MHEGVTKEKHCLMVIEVLVKSVREELRRVYEPLFF